MNSMKEFIKIIPLLEIGQELRVMSNNGYKRKVLFKGLTPKGTIKVHNSYELEYFKSTGFKNGEWLEVIE